MVNRNSSEVERSGRAVVEPLVDVDVVAASGGSAADRRLGRARDGHLRLKRACRGHATRLRQTGALPEPSLGPARDL